MCGWRDSERAWCEPDYLLVIRYNFGTGHREIVDIILRNSKRHSTMETGGNEGMNGKIVVGLKTTPRGVFVACPVCRKGKLTHLYEDTTASGV